MKSHVKATKAEPKKSKKTKSATAMKANGKPLVFVQTVDGPPKLSLPAIPAGFKEPGKEVMSRYKKPTDGQRASAVDVANEVRRATGYHADFGEQAPDQATTADALVVAAAWDTTYDDAAAYAAYALGMRAAAWDAALRPVTRLHARYEVASTDDAKLTKKYAKLAGFFGVREEVAARGAATRKSNAKRKKAAAAAAQAATTTSTSQH